MGGGGIGKKTVEWRERDPARQLWSQTEAEWDVVAVVSPWEWDLRGLKPAREEESGGEGKGREGSTAHPEPACSALGGGCWEGWDAQEDIH